MTPHMFSGEKDGVFQHKKNSLNYWKTALLRMNKSMGCMLKNLLHGKTENQLSFQALAFMENSMRMVIMAITIGQVTYGMETQCTPIFMIAKQ